VLPGTCGLACNLTIGGPRRLLEAITVIVATSVEDFKDTVMAHVDDFEVRLGTVAGLPAMPGLHSVRAPDRSAMSAGGTQNQ
jgi:hypothetical protein